MARCRGLVWYMVYRVRYRGGELRPAAEKIAGVDIYSVLNPSTTIRDTSFP